MYNQLPMQAQLRHENMRGTRFETWAVLENIKLVHLVRRSHIRRVLSVLRMKATHVAHVRDPANVTTSSMTPLVDIEAKTFVDMVMKSVSASNKMSKSLRDSMPKTSVLEVEYEQLVDNAGQFHRVVDFISPDLARFVQRMKATTLQRSPPTACADLILNWPTIFEELRARKGELKIKSEIDDLDFALNDCAMVRATRP